jgi:hypothetical protein
MCGLANSFFAAGVARYSVIADRGEAEETDEPGSPQDADSISETQTLGPVHDWTESSGMPPARNDDGFTERSLVFFLADGMYRA